MIVFWSLFLLYWPSAVYSVPVTLPLLDSDHLLDDGPEMKYFGRFETSDDLGRNIYDDALLPMFRLEETIKGTAEAESRRASMLEEDSAEAAIKAAVLREESKAARLHAEHAMRDLNSLNSMINGFSKDNEQRSERTQLPRLNDVLLNHNLLIHKKLPPVRKPQTNDAEEEVLGELLNLAWLSKALKEARQHEQVEQIFEKSTEPIEPEATSRLKGMIAALLSNSNERVIPHDKEVNDDHSDVRSLANADPLIDTELVFNKEE